jgi:hypothetical protein
MGECYVSSAAVSSIEYSVGERSELTLAGRCARNAYRMDAIEIKLS